MESAAFVITFLIHSQMADLNWPVIEQEILITADEFGMRGANQNYADIVLADKDGDGFTVRRLSGEPLVEVRGQPLAGEFSVQRLHEEFRLVLAEEDKGRPFCVKFKSRNDVAAMFWHPSNDWAWRAKACTPVVS